MTTEAAAELASITRRLDLFEAEREIQLVLYRYGECLDYGLEDEWVDLFTPDAVWEVVRPDGSGIKCSGTNELKHFASGHTRAPDKYHKHLALQPQIRVTGDQATSVCYFTRLDATFQGPVVYVYGRYHDRCVRCADGRWRFQHRRAEVEAFSPWAPPLGTRRAGS